MKEELNIAEFRTLYKRNSMQQVRLINTDEVFEKVVVTLAPDVLYLKSSKSIKKFPFVSKIIIGNENLKCLAIEVFCDGTDKEGY